MIEDANDNLKELERTWKHGIRNCGGKSGGIQVVNSVKN